MEAPSIGGLVLTLSLSKGGNKYLQILWDCYRTTVQCFLDDNQYDLNQKKREMLHLVGWAMPTLRSMSFSQMV